MDMITRQWQNGAIGSMTNWSYLTRRRPVWKVIFRSLKESVEVKFTQNVGMDKNAESNIFDPMKGINLTFDTIHRLQRNHNHNNNDCGNHNSKDNADKPKGNGKETSKDKYGKRQKNPCQIPGQGPEWKYCYPTTKFSRNFKLDCSNNNGKQQLRKAREG